MSLHIPDRLAPAVACFLLALCAAGVNEAHAQPGARLGKRNEAAAPQPAARRPAGARFGDRDKRRRARQTTSSQNAPATRDEGPEGRLVEEGLRHAEAGDWAAAIKSYREAIAANPRHAEAHILLGDAYMSSGGYEEAFVAYKEAVRVAPANAEAHYALGSAYNDMAEYGDAFRPLVRAIQLAPDHAEAHYGIGYAYLKLENFKDALPYLKRAASARPDFAEAHLALGLNYLGLKQTKAAEQQLRLLETLDAVLARELDAEIRSAAGLAATATPAPTPKSDQRPSQEPSARGLRLSQTPAANRETPDANAKTQKAEPAAKQKAEPAAKLTPNAPTRPPRADEAAQPARPAPQGAQTAAPSPLAFELSFWDSIKNSSDPAEFSAYLKKYPEGEFAELAAIRLRALEAKRGDPTPTQPAQPPPPAAEATPAPTPTPDPLAETLKTLKQEFPNKFTYKVTAPGADPGVVSVTSEVLVEYEPLQFDNCQLEWRDTKDVLSVPLAQLDPAGVRVEERARPDTTFSAKVWNLTLSTSGDRHVIREFKGDGSGAVNNYNGLDLQFDNRDKAERLARLLRTAINLCADGQKTQ